MEFNPIKKIWPDLYDDRSIEEKYPEAELVIFVFRRHFKANVSQAFIDRIRDGFREEKVIKQGTKSYGFTLNKGTNKEARLYPEIKYCAPERPFRPVESTEMKFMDYLYYTPEMDTFDIPEKRKVGVKQLPENEKDVEIDSAWNMVNIFDKNPEADIFVDSAKDEYLCNGYWFNFEDEE